MAVVLQTVDLIYCSEVIGTWLDLQLLQLDVLVENIYDLLLGSYQSLCVLLPVFFHLLRSICNQEIVVYLSIWVLVFSFLYLVGLGITGSSFAFEVVLLQDGVILILDFALRVQVHQRSRAHGNLVLMILALYLVLQIHDVRVILIPQDHQRLRRL